MDLGTLTGASSCLIAITVHTDHLTCVATGREFILVNMACQSGINQSSLASARATEPSTPSAVSATQQSAGQRWLTFGQGQRWAAIAANRQRAAPTAATASSPPQAHSRVLEHRAFCRGLATTDHPTHRSAGQPDDSARLDPTRPDSTRLCSARLGSARRDEARQSSSSPVIRLAAA